MKYQLNVNGKNVTTEADSDTPLLYVLRDNLALQGLNTAAVWVSVVLVRCWSMDKPCEAASRPSRV